MSEAKVSVFVVNRIRELLAARDWNQSELCRRADLSVMNLSDILNGKTEPSLVVVMKIAEAAGLTVDDFFPPKRTD